MLSKNLWKFKIRPVFEIALDNWAIVDAVDLSIPVGTTIQPDEILVLVSFDPGSEPEKTTTFRNYYGIDESVNLVGPWGADTDGDPDTISNGGEKITLTTPLPDLDEILQIPTDQVDFNDRLPWPVVADGSGGSLHRLSPESYGNRAESWYGGFPTPGNQPIDYFASPELLVDELVTGNIGQDGEFDFGAGRVRCVPISADNVRRIQILSYRHWRNTDRKICSRF